MLLSMSDNPVTREELKQELAALETRLVEKMRDMQTELLRGFEAFSGGQTLRLRKDAK
jgi:hypothetical protein